MSVKHHGSLLSPWHLPFLLLLRLQHWVLEQDHLAWLSVSGVLKAPFEGCSSLLTLHTLPRQPQSLLWCLSLFSWHIHLYLHPTLSSALTVHLSNFLWNTDVSRCLRCLQDLRLNMTKVEITFYPHAWGDDATPPQWMALPFLQRHKS